MCQDVSGTIPWNLLNTSGLEDAVSLTPLSDGQVGVALQPLYQAQWVGQERNEQDTLPETNMETQKGPYKDYSPFKRRAMGVSMLVCGSIAVGLWMPHTTFELTI